MAETNNQTTLIAADTRIKGEMVFEKTARIQGEFDGKISGNGELQVDGSATCSAEVEKDNIVVDGTIEGNVKATQKVQLNAKARIKGDIVAQLLAAEEGASILGHVTIGGDAVKAAGGNARSSSSSSTATPAAPKAQASGKPEQVVGRKSGQRGT